MEILSSIIGSFGAYLVPPIGKQFSFLISYKRNIENFENKYRELQEKKEAVKKSVAGAQYHRKDVTKVQKWMTDVEKKIEEDRKFHEEDVKNNAMCFYGWCPDLKLRYSLGKKAQKNTRAIIDLLTIGEHYDEAYNITIPPSELIPSSRFKGFESRESIIRNVLEALKDDTINMIALCGMGGIGKTEMAEEIKRRVLSNNLFQNVAIATVSQSPNPTKIQSEIAEKLGPRLEPESLGVRADELYSRLKNKNVLVILDDIWDHLDLEKIGISSALIREKSCKILLTTRNKDTCDNMKAKIFPIGLLSEEEAWNLFSEMVGDCINTHDLIWIAKQVAKECACLPIAIATVGSALRNKSEEFEWKATLHNLKRSAVEKKIRTCIGSSYDRLESSEQKCFLLCCLFPENYDIPIEDLVSYAFGRGLFQGIDKVADLRQSVNQSVACLKRSNLLLDSEKEECIKMHDVVRDVAISIASKDEHGFLVLLDRIHEEWPENYTHEGYVAISLVIGEMKKYPDELRYPKLELLQLLSGDAILENFPDNLFCGMEKLKALSLKQVSLSSWPQSIKVLVNLRMLHLVDCRLQDVSVIGELVKLEILRFLNCKTEKIPREIGNLSRLKLLDLSNCDALKGIALGVLEKLSRLEELYLPKFDNWESSKEYASLDELIPYSKKMTAFAVTLSSIRLLPERLDFDNQRLKYGITIADEMEYSAPGYLLENNRLVLNGGDASDILKHRVVRPLLKTCRFLGLAKIKNMKSISCVDDQELCPQLRKLTVSLFKDVEYLINESSHQILHRACPVLESVTIQSMDSLQVIYRHKLPTQFPKTRHNEHEKAVDHVINFPKLKYIELRRLPKLIGFCDGMGQVELMQSSMNDKVYLTTQEERNVRSLFPYSLIEGLQNLERLDAYQCDSLQVIFELEGLQVKESNIFNKLTRLLLQSLSKLLHIWKKGSRDIKGFDNLRWLEVYGCHSLKHLFSPCLAKLLVRLETIKVMSCKEMEEIIAKELEGEKKTNMIAFPQLNILLLEDLPKLECFYAKENYDFELPSLNEMKIAECDKLKMFVSTSVNTPMLKKVRTEQEPAQPIVQENLNVTVQHIYQRKVQKFDKGDHEKSPDSRQPSRPRFPIS